MTVVDGRAQDVGELVLRLDHSHRHRLEPELSGCAQAVTTVQHLSPRVDLERNGDAALAYVGNKDGVLAASHRRDVFRSGVIVQLGGQTPLSVPEPLEVWRKFSGWTSRPGFSPH